MKQFTFYFILLFSILLFSGLIKNNNHMDKTNYIWTQCSLPQNYRVTDFGISGNNIIAGAFKYMVYSSYAFLCKSSDNGVNWLEYDSIVVNNQPSGFHYFFDCNLTFFNNGTNLF